MDSTTNFLENTSEHSSTKFSCRNREELFQESYRRSSDESTGISPWISSKNFCGVFSKYFSGYFLQDFFLGIFEENLSGHFFSLEVCTINFFGDFVQEFLRGFNAVISPGINSRNSSSDLLQEFFWGCYPEIRLDIRGFSPGIHKGISSGSPLGIPFKILSGDFFNKFIRRFFSIFFIRSFILKEFPWGFAPGISLDTSFRDFLLEFKELLLGVSSGIPQGMSNCNASRYFFQQFFSGFCPEIHPGVLHYERIVSRNSFVDFFFF